MLVTNARRVQFNNKQQAKIAWKRKQALTMATGIRDFLQDQGVDVTKRLKDGYEEFEEVQRFYFKMLKVNKGVYAVFFDEYSGRKGVQLLACWYSKHRLCPVWNFRKSQLVRKLFFTYLKEKIVGHDKNGDPIYLIQKFTPVHIVLTVPHKNGYWNGKRFFAKEMLKKFHALRRSEFWKKAVYGGEYGLEIKRSKSNNGLHIHVHSMAFINPEYSIKKVREFITRRWGELTGAKFVHVGGLYYHKKDKDGRYIMDLVQNVNKVIERREKSGSYIYEPESTLVRKRFYINKKSSLEDYTSAVLETIKYHFKGDTMVCPDGDIDVPLMMDILNQSKNLRFYSRYGAFYKEPMLAFAKLKDKDENEDESEEVKLASTDGIEVINPFTLKVDENYRMALCNPERLRYSGSKASVRPFELLNFSDRFFVPIIKGFTLKEVLGAVCSSNFRSVQQATHFKEKIIS